MPGTNEQRQLALAKLFAEAGCDGEHLSQQAVKHLQQSNVICFLPGSSARAIIVGAHFDRVPDSDGVVDNWSGASLLASLYQSIRSQPAGIAIFSSVSREKRRERSVPIFMRSI